MLYQGLAAEFIIGKTLSPVARNAITSRQIRL
jgi:hypothetical protein